MCPSLPCRSVFHPPTQVTTYHYYGPLLLFVTQSVVLPPCFSCRLPAVGALCLHPLHCLQLPHRQVLQHHSRSHTEAAPGPAAGLPEGALQAFDNNLQTTIAKKIGLLTEVQAVPHRAGLSKAKGHEVVGHQLGNHTPLDSNNHNRHYDVQMQQGRAGLKGKQIKCLPFSHPFWQSVESVEAGELDRQTRSLLRFLLRQLPAASNFSPAMAKIARQVRKLVAPMVLSRSNQGPYLCCLP